MREKGKNYKKYKNAKKYTVRSGKRTVPCIYI